MSFAAVAELVDARVSGTRVLRDVEVRILSAAPLNAPEARRGVILARRPAAIV
jgi:hypothetical protein